MSKLNWPEDGRHIFVGGRWHKLENAERIPAISPIDEQVVGYVAAARRDDVEEAVKEISPALRPWNALGALGRAPYLREFATAIAEHADELGELEMVDGGLTARTVDRDLKMALNSLDLFASYATMIQGQTYSTSEDLFAYTVREPYGIVARIIPFNHPIMFAVGFAAAVLIAGNAVILKPPEQASLSALALAEIARGIFPPGVFNVITGYGHEVGAAIVDHPAIPRIGFTGSVPTGRRIAAAGAAHIKHVTLELGGKNPLIITEDADPELASTIALQGMNFTHAGQSCLSTPRVLIQANLYDTVVDGLAAKMRALVVGDPRDPLTDTGPVAFKEHYDRVLNYIAVAVEEGAKLVVGGDRPKHLPTGLYIEPTLFSEVTQNMRIAKEEVFGPVVAAMRFSDVSEAIDIANDTEYGLNSRVVAGNLDDAMAIGREIKAGMTLLNKAAARPRGTPAGGYKESGYGKMGCLEEVLSYTQERTIVASM